MSDRLPIVDFSLDGVWCSLHASPWKDTWERHRDRFIATHEPTGPILAGLQLVEALLQRAEVAARYGDAIENFRQADWQPICCYIGRHDPPTLLQAYATARAVPPRREG